LSKNNVRLRAPTVREGSPASAWQDGALVEVSREEESKVED
jgi:hypothetical protein